MVSIIKSLEEFDKVAFQKVCAENNISFPKEYIEFLELNNDGELDSNIIYDFDDCAVEYFFGTTSEIYSNFGDNLEIYKGRMPELCIPIAEAEGGNLLCMSLDEKSYGTILWWDHEIMDVDEGESCPYSIGDMHIIAKNFDELLRKIVPD